MLQLPPYHRELNRIKLVWGFTKGYVARNNTTFKMADVRQLFETALSLADAKLWSSCVSHIREKAEEEIWKLDGIIDVIVEPLIIHFNREDSSSESDNEEFM